MNKIRVLLGNHPLIIPDALRQMIADQDDMELVGDCRGPMRILQESGRANADVVILGQEGSEDLACAANCSPCIQTSLSLTVEPDLGNVFSQQLCSHRCGVYVGEHGDIVQWMRRLMRDPCSDERL